MGEKIITTNRRAGRDYHILEKYEAGIALQGTEVKTLRMTGNVQLKDSYVDVRRGELYLIGAHIPPYEQGNIYNHPPERDRKLLMHKREILRIAQKAAEKGLTLVPLKFYFKDGRVKVEVGLCKGKREYEKRDTVQKKEAGREIERALKDFKSGRSD
jgi:SsrA-binding protein